MNENKGITNPLLKNEKVQQTNYDRIHIPI